MHFLFFLKEFVTAVGRCTFIPGVILAFEEKGPVFFCPEAVGNNCLTFEDLISLMIQS